MELRGKGPRCAASGLEIEFPKIAVELKVPALQGYAHQLFQALLWCGIGLILLICTLAGWVLAIKAFGMPHP